MIPGRLRPTLPFESDESPTSFASRLAHLHGRTAAAFCSDLGIRLQALADGGDVALGRLAVLSGAEIDRLRHNSVVRLGYRVYAWRGETLHRDGLSRQTLRVCPACLAEDVERSRRGSGHGPYGRAIWLLRQLRTCPDHHVALTALPASWRTVHDFAATVGPILREGSNGAGERFARIPSRLETYLLDRLQARRTPQAAWLDHLGFAAVADACETLGAVPAFGRSAPMRGLDDRAWHVAGDMGFVVVSEGPSAIREALRAWDAGQADDETPGAVPMPTYGAFHTFLSRTRERRPDLDPIRDVVSDHVHRTRPVGPGDLVLGAPAGQRLVHSLKTAAEEYGLDVRVVRKVLNEAGVISAESDASPARAGLFDARSHASLLGDVARAVPASAVATYLNAGRADASAIMRVKLVRPLYDGGTSGPHARRYAPETLDEFLTSLVEGAEKVATPPPGTCGPAGAAAKAGIDPIEVMRMVLGGRLGWVGCLADRRGYDSIVVRLDDVASIAGTSEPTEWTLDALAAELGLGHAVLAELTEAGLLQMGAANLRNGVRVHRRVSERGVRRFLDDYAWLAMLGWEWGRDPRLCRKVLNAAGITPAFTTSGGTRFYHRCDVDRLPEASARHASGRRRAPHRP